MKKDIAMTSLESLKIAVVAMTSSDHKSENWLRAKEWLDQAAKAGASWILFPEIFLYNGPYQHFSEISEHESGELVQELASLAKHYQMVIFAGSIHEAPHQKHHHSNGSARVYNTMYVLGRDGSILAKYRKCHLFNLYDDQGAKVYCESDGFLAGDQPKTVEIDGFHVALSICYDLRFGSYYQYLERNQPLDIIMVPAAFTQKTGEAHWQILLQARAIESQAYVVAANQTGTSSPGKACFGHSMIIDPWGTVLCNTETSEGLAFAEVSKSRIHQVRSMLPALKNRRPELYL